MSEERQWGSRVGTVVTTPITPNIIESVCKGRLTAEIAGSLRSQLRPYFNGGQLCWLLNLEEVSGVDLAASDDSSGFYAWFQQNGGDRIAVVMQSATLRMVISSLAFALGTVVRVFESRDMALEHLAVPVPALKGRA